MFNLESHQLCGAHAQDRQAHLLHVIERVEQRIDEPRGHLHEVRKICLHCVIDVFVFVGGNLEVLLKLSRLGISRVM